MKNLKERLILIHDVIYKALNIYAKFVLLIVIAIVCAQVIARNVFRGNIRWNQEVSLLLTIWMAFAGIAIGVEKNLHISVELFFTMFPKTLQKVVTVCNKILIILVGVFFTIYGTAICISTRTSTLPVTKLPSTLMYIMIPVSGVCIIYFVLIDMLGIKREAECSDQEGRSEI